MKKLSWQIQAGRGASSIAGKIALFVLFILMPKLFNLSPDFVGVAENLSLCKHGSIVALNDNIWILQIAGFEPDANGAIVKGGQQSPSPASGRGVGVRGLENESLFGPARKPASPALLMN